MDILILLLCLRKSQLLSISGRSKQNIPMNIDISIKKSLTSSTLAECMEGGVYSVSSVTIILNIQLMINKESIKWDLNSSDEWNIITMIYTKRKHHNSYIKQSAYTQIYIYIYIYIYINRMSQESIGGLPKSMCYQSNVIYYKQVVCIPEHFKIWTPARGKRNAWFRVKQWTNHAECKTHTNIKCLWGNI